MTKLEALAKDCIENHTHRLVDKPTKQDIYLREESIFIQGYRQSEKRIAELEKENAELKADNDARKFAMVMSEKVEKQLREENESLESIKNIYIGDLLKAKRIINKLSTCFSSYSSNIFEEELLKEAEQFINYSEV